MHSKNVFVTGATGYIGGAIAREFKAAGHRVSGLARSAEARAKLLAENIWPISGNLRDADQLTRAAQAASAEVIVHAAFEHDSFERYQEATAVETAAVRALATAAKVHGAKFIYTSGTGTLGDTGSAPVADRHVTNPPPFLQWRKEL